MVDDEAPVRTALRRLLRLADYEVAAFGSGEDFLASLTTRRPDCVILDVHMPGLSGFDVQARLCAANMTFPSCSSPRATISSSTGRCRERGASALLRKPFSNDELLAAVVAALRSKACDAS